jgi:predicted nucleotidyltransferase
MQEDALWITRLKNLLSDKNIDHHGINIMAFGSCARSEKINDIDLLLVYKRDMSLKHVIEIRERLRQEISYSFGFPVSFCTFSNVEAVTNPFLYEEGAVLIASGGDFP